MTTAQDALSAGDASAPAATALADGRRRWLVAALLVAAVAGAFGNALRNEFVYDDRLLIVDNPAVRAPVDDLRALRFYRPLRTLSYRLDYAIGGLDPRVFHASNLVYHAITVLLLCALLQRAGASLWAAAAGALVFAVHPVQTDAVTYAAGRRDVLCGLFFAAGFLSYLRYRATKSRRALAATVAAYVLAILAKEMAVTLPVVCWLFDRFAGGTARPARRLEGPVQGAAPIGGGASGSTIKRLSALAALGALGLVVGWWVYGRFIGRVIEVTPWHGGSPGANFATVARIWLHYLGLIVWPARLSADYSYDAFPLSTSMLDPRALAAALVLALVAVVSRRAWRRGTLAGFGAAWLAITLLPVSHLIPYRELLAEHYLYIPMIGVAFVVAGAVDAAARVAAPRWIIAVVLLVAAAAAARTVVRNRDWHDPVTLWSATVAAVPNCARARFNLGQAHFARVELDAAEREWLAAAAITPDDLDTLVALAAVYYRQARFVEAERWIAAAHASKPEDGRVQNLAGWIALDGGDAARALPLFDAALERLAAAKVRRGSRYAGENEAREGARLGREQAAAALASAARGASGAP